MDDSTVHSDTYPLDASADNGKGFVDAPRGAERSTIDENFLEPNVIDLPPIHISDETKHSQNKTAIERDPVEGNPIPTTITSQTDSVSSPNPTKEQPIACSDPAPTPGSPPFPTHSPLLRSPSISIPRTSAMPSLADLTDLTLHSPSSQIVGTPFATDTTRFEYPFPEAATSELPSSSPPLISSMADSPELAVAASSSSYSLASFVSPKSGGSFPAISTSSSTTKIISPLISYPIPAEISLSYNTAHPKLKAQSNPPIPPSLAKKATRWSLNLLGRRKSSYGSQSSVTEVSSTNSSVLGGHPQSTSPLGSPKEKSNH